MFDAHPPFQIDGNFGGAAGIMEMLVQSWGDELRILPALPAAWVNGRISGVRARGGLNVSLAWRQGKPTSLTLLGPAGATVRIRADGESFQAKVGATGRYQRAWS